MTRHPTDITALVGSRICHDLINPLGAVGNGVELLTLVGSAGSDSPEMELITQSIESASARVRYFRIAFGAASADQSVKGREMLSMINGCYVDTRILVHAQVPDAVARPDAKLALLLVLCLETALPQGGEITLASDGTRWRLHAQGPALRTEERLWQRLTTHPAQAQQLASSEVQFALLPDAATTADRALAVNLAAKSIEIRF